MLSHRGREEGTRVPVPWLANGPILLRAVIATSSAAGTSQGAKHRQDQHAICCMPAYALLTA